MDVFYDELLLDLPADGTNPFTYAKSDRPYLLWFSNRTYNCSKLFPEPLKNAREMFSLAQGNNLKPHALDSGYTALLQYERLFALYMGEVSRSDIYKKHLDDRLIYLKDGLSESIEVADNLLFIMKRDEESPVETTNATWAWNPKLIKELTGKEFYSVSDARKVIKNMRYSPICVFACIGVRTVWNEDWH
jgi:hypothetical protein